MEHDFLAAGWRVVHWFEEGMMYMTEPLAWEFDPEFSLLELVLLVPFAVLVTCMLHFSLEALSFDCVDEMNTPIGRLLPRVIRDACIH